MDEEPIFHRPLPAVLHCIYCHAKLFVEDLRANPEAAAFIDKHEEECGKKAVGAIVDF